MPVAAIVLKLLLAHGSFSSDLFASGKRFSVQAKRKDKITKLLNVHATSGTNPAVAQTQNAGGGSSGLHLGGFEPAMASADMPAMADGAPGEKWLPDHLWEPEDNKKRVSSEDADMEDADMEAYQAFMAQTRPKDAVDGVLQGLKSAGGGIASGVGMAVFAPVAGAREGGMPGFAKGLGLGILGGGALAIGGTAAGVAQVLRGIYMAPVAHRARREEKIWDQESGSWVEVDLRAEIKSLEAENSDREDRSTRRQGGEVAETEYYDLLNVDPDASQREIKKAYFQTARACHPDKNMGDDTATQNFQKLTEVYRVLSDPDEREKYDRNGKDALQEQHLKIDPTLFFSLLFGLEHFTPWIGEAHELFVVMHAADFTKEMNKANAGKQGPDISGAGSVLMKKQQRQRQVRCAMHLRDKLNGLVDDMPYREEQNRNEQMRVEARQLASDSGEFGPALLLTIGQMYQIRSEIYLADQLAGHLSFRKFKASMKQNVMKMQQMASFYWQAAISLLRVKKMYNAAKADEKEMNKFKIEGEDLDEAAQADNVQAAFDDALPTFMKTAFTFVIRDIDETLKIVVSKLLQDKSVPWQIRIRRGQALKRLGHIFVEEGQKAAAEMAASRETKEFGQERAKAALEEALNGAMQQN